MTFLLTHLPKPPTHQVFCEILPTRVVPTLFYAVITAFMAGLRTDFYHLSMYWLTLTVRGDKRERRLGLYR